MPHRRDRCRAARAFRSTALEQALCGARINETALAQAAALLVSDVAVLSDSFADRDYRAHLARVMTLRALKKLALRPASETI